MRDREAFEEWAIDFDKKRMALVVHGMASSYESSESSCNGDRGCCLGPFEECDGVIYSNKYEECTIYGNRTLK